MGMIPNIRNYELPDMPLVSIGAASQLLGISVNTLRLYEAEGLILPARTAKNQRRYSRTDLARVTCIMHAIREEGMTMNAIKRMIAMIPCWESLGCSDEDRVGCAAYSNSQQPCWTYDHTKNRCAGRNCRQCPVYRLASDCDSIKASIVNSTRRS